MAWAPDYAATGELRSMLRIGDTADDVDLALAISTASRVIDRHCDRQFGLVATPEARTYEAKWSRKLGMYLAEIDDVQTLTGLVVTVSGATVASSLYELYELNAGPKGLPWTRLAVTAATTPTLGTGPKTVEVTARWGWTTVPDNIKWATLMQATRLANRPKSPYGVAGSPDLGNELRLLAKLDSDVAVHIEPFRRYGAYVG